MDRKSVEKKLLEAAWRAESRAYAPYSKFHVGAAVLAQGQVFSGCNVENASYGLTVCAERNAVARAVGENTLSSQSLDAVLVAVRSKNATFPCGACRQVLNEFAHEKTLVYLSIEEGVIHETCLFSELLPQSFGPSDLGTTHE